MKRPHENKWVCASAPSADDGRQFHTPAGKMLLMARITHKCSRNIWKPLNPKFSSQIFFFFAVLDEWFSIAYDRKRKLFFFLAPRGRGCVEKMFLTPWNYQQHELLIQGRMDCHHHPHHPVAFLSHWISLILLLWPATAHSCFPFSQTITNKNKRS